MTWPPHLIFSVAAAAGGVLLCEVKTCSEHAMENADYSSYSNTIMIVVVVVMVVVVGLCVLCCAAWLVGF